MIRIVAINSKYVHTLLAPYYLKENSTVSNIDIVQTNINNVIDDIVALSVKDMPIAIAFSTYIFNVNTVEAVCLKIKELYPNIKIILGGPEVSFEYDGNYPYADYIITGEGESAFDRLANAIMNGEEMPRIINGAPMELSEINSPYSDDYFRDVDGKIAYFEGSRGCPFSCAYCMSGGAKLRYFGLEKVFSELEKFKGKNIRVLKFVDRTFNANIEYAKAILKYIISNKDEYSFGFHFEIAADIMDDEFVELVASSPKGLFQFEIGVQSFNKDTLNAVIRKTNSEKVLKNISSLVATRKAHIHTDLIAGLPYEDLESFKKGFDILYSIGSDMLQLGFLKVLKGSRLKGMIGDGYIYSSKPPYEIISTPYLTVDDIHELKIVEDAVDKYANSGLFKYTLTRFVGESSYKFYLELGKVSIKTRDLFGKIEVLYNFLAENNDAEIVKNLLTVDYVSTNNSRVLPPILKRVYDKEFKKVLKIKGIDSKKYYAVLLDINPITMTKEQCIAIADYSDNKNIVVSYVEYKLTKEELEREKLCK